MMAQRLEPLFDRLVVKELEPPEMRKSGLALPPSAREQHAAPQEGIVLAVGPGLDWWGGSGVEMPVRAGDHVMFPWRAGTYITVDEERLLVLRVGELLGIVHDDVPGEPRHTGATADEQA